MNNRNKKYCHTLLLTLTLLIVHSSLLIATVRFVSKTGSSEPPFLTLETAADSIQECINISVFGDTIYVANGVYQEQVVMIPGLSLIGAGMDSCVINLTSTGIPAVEIKDTCLFCGFKILLPNAVNTWGIKAEQNGYGSKVILNKIVNSSLGMSIRYSDPFVYKNIFESNKSIGIRLFNSNSIVRKNEIFMSTSGASVNGIYITAITSSYQPIIDSNYIVVSGGLGIYETVAVNPLIKNNTIILKYQSTGILLQTPASDSTRIYNNLILVDSISAISGIVNSGVTYLELDNNYLSGKYLLDGLLIDGYDKVRNNVVVNAETGVGRNGTENPIFKHNNLWNNSINYANFTPDTTNLSVNPMVVNDDSTQGELDFHLQKYSPLIDGGDPTILDRDGSRSDIGLYGGPYGWTYTYNDLAPRPPHNVTAAIEDGFVKLTWNKNTEADFSHYRIYRDTLTIVIYDSTKMIGETPDTAFYDNLPPLNHETRFYYVITALDNQGNQSYSSEEINVLVTGLGEYPPKGYDGYRLLSNYPNPFNPSTIIPYRLKEGGYVKLYVYDVKGELVRVLVNQWQERGYYEVMFNPNSQERQRANSFEVPMGKTYSDIATGVYLYMIQVYNDRNIPVFSDSGKMILLK
jgi:parallel beta-helix repeat protein